MGMSFSRINNLSLGAKVGIAATVFLVIAAIILGALGGIGLFGRGGRGGGRGGSKTMSPTMPSQTVGPTNSPTMPSQTVGPTNSPTSSPTSSPIVFTSSSTIAPTSPIVFTSPSTIAPTSPVIHHTIAPTSPVIHHTIAPILPTMPSTIAPTTSSTGPLSSNFTTSNGQTWQKVYDSMLNPTKCFISFSNLQSTLSASNILKVTKYMYNNGMLPVDNPFQYTIDVPVVNCSPDGSRLVLGLDLTNYGGVLPFNQGDNIYIFGVNGETTSNTVISSTGLMTGPRYVYATNKEYSKYILPTVNNVGYIMLSSTNPCNDTGYCNIDNANLLFASGTYTNGGTVRFISNYTGYAYSFIVKEPQTMFYIYMAYKGYAFNWPYSPITAAQAYSQYSSYYPGFMQWITTLPFVTGTACSQASLINNSNGFVSGPVTVTGGSGTGMQIYLISMILFGYSAGFPIVTNDGNGYITGDIITLTQGSASITTSITVGQNCMQQTPAGILGLSYRLYLSYTITPRQLQNIINYAVGLDSTINTVVLFSNSSPTVPENYNNPNMSIIFAKTTPDNTFTGTQYAGNAINIGPICICNGQQDQDSPQTFFPNKINQCANQVIFTSSTNSQPFDFADNASTIIGTNCSVNVC